MAKDALDIAIVAPVEETSEGAAAGDAFAKAVKSGKGQAIFDAFKELQAAADEEEEVPVEDESDEEELDLE